LHWLLPRIDISRDENGHLRIVHDETPFEGFAAACFS
jgi:hypothetical protein